MGEAEDSLENECVRVLTDLSERCEEGLQETSFCGWRDGVQMLLCPAEVESAQQRPRNLTSNLSRLITPRAGKPQLSPITQPRSNAEDRLTTVAVLKKRLSESRSMGRLEGADVQYRPALQSALVPVGVLPALSPEAARKQKRASLYGELQRPTHSRKPPRTGLTVRRLQATGSTPPHSPRELPYIAMLELQRQRLSACFQQVGNGLDRRLGE